VSVKLPALYSSLVKSLKQTQVQVCLTTSRHIQNLHRKTVLVGGVRHKGRQSAHNWHSKAVKQQDGRTRTSELSASISSPWCMIVGSQDQRQQSLRTGYLNSVQHHQRVERHNSQGRAKGKSK
jgi:hypothetical protein